MRTERNISDLEQTRRARLRDLRPATFTCPRCTLTVRGEAWQDFDCRVCRCAMRRRLGATRSDR